ncbi:MAG: hypothetical protein LBR20_00190 [Propionibacteriaceae bacterium]|jgi:hypothetical protein|nr:hypothetical protein [Propionibacteriaceae bacterium]
MKKMLVMCATALVGVLATASVASAAPGSFMSFGGQTYGVSASTPVTNGVLSTESPDKIMAGDSSGFQTVSFGVPITAGVSVGQVVTTSTK